MNIALVPYHRAALVFAAISLRRAVLTLANREKEALRFEESLLPALSLVRAFVDQPEWIHVKDCGECLGRFFQFVWQAS